MPSSASICCRAVEPTSLSRAPLAPMTIGLLARPLDVHDGVHVDEVLPARAGRHLLDHDGDRVRELVPDALQDRLADELGHQLLLRLVGQVAVRVQRPPRRQVTNQHVGRVRPAGSRTRPRPARCRPSRRARRRRRAARDLLAGWPGRSWSRWRRPALAARPASSAARYLSPGPIRSPAGTQKPTTSTSVRVDAHQAVQALAEQGPRPVQTGRVHDDQLGVRAVHDAPDGPPGGLRAAAGDGDLGCRPGRSSAWTCRRSAGRRSRRTPTGIRERPASGTAGEGERGDLTWRLSPSRAPAR